MLNPAAGNLIWETTIGVATDTINVPSGLLGEDEYLIRLDVKSDAVATASPSLFANGDTTDANYQTRRLEVATTVQSWLFSIPSVCAVYQNEENQCEIRCVASNERFWARCDNIQVYTASDVVLDQRVITNDSITSNKITALQFYSPVADAFGVGTIVKVYKRS